MKTNTLKSSSFILFMLFMVSCTPKNTLKVSVVETSRSGNKLTSINQFVSSPNNVKIAIHPEKKYQKRIKTMFSEQFFDLLLNLGDDWKVDEVKMNFILEEVASFRYDAV